MSTRFVQMKEATLQSSISSSATEAVFIDFVDLAGVPVVQTDFGDVGYGTLEPNTAREEAVSFVVTSNPSGTATLTLTRGLRGKHPYGTGGASFAHNAGSKFVVSNNPDLLNKLTAKDNDEIIEGSWQFPATPTLDNNPATKGYVDTEVDAAIAVANTKVGLTGNETVAGIKTFSSSPIVPTPTSNTQAANKQYVDGVAIAGAPDANETTKGIVEEATDAEVLAGTATGSTGAKLFITPAKLKAFNDGKALVVVGKSSSQVVSATTAQITFDTEDIDVGGNFASNQFVAPRTGYYQIDFFASFSSNSSSAQGNEVEIRVNGTAVFEGAQITASNTGGHQSQISMSSIRSLTASDVVTVFFIASGHIATISSGAFTKLTIKEL